MLMHIGNKCYTIARFIIQGCSFLVLFFLAILNLCYRNERVGNVKVPIFSIANFIMGIIAFLFFSFLSYHIIFYIKKREKLVVALVLIFNLFLGISLIIFGKTGVTADSATLYMIAESFSQNDYSAIMEETSYLQYYPHQLGTILFFEVIFRVLNFLSIEIAALHFIKLINCFLCMIFIYMQWLVIKLLSKDDMISLSYLFFLVFCWPLFIYTSYLYGEIPSITMLSIGIYFLVKFQIEQIFVHGLGLIVFSGLAVLLRNNSSIVIIAIIIILIVHSIKVKKYAGVFLAIGIVISCVACSSLVRGLYEYKGNAQLSQGISPYAWMAMGLHDSVNGAGVYDGYNFKLYEQTNGNYDEMTRLSLQDLEKSLAYYIEYPQKGLSFFHRKILTQWSVGEFSSLDFTRVTIGNRINLLQEIYEGKWTNIFLRITDLFQSTVYVGALIVSIDRLKQNKDIEVWDVFSIALVGGFIFHLIWEASARYAFPYFILLLPYAMMGVVKVGEGIHNRMKVNHRL